MVSCTFAAIGFPASTPSLSCFHQFSVGCCPHIALVPQGKAGPSPSSWRWTLAGLGKCSQLTSDPGLRDWQVSQGSICWGLLRRKPFPTFLCSFTEALLKELSFLTGLGCPCRCWQPSCDQEGRQPWAEGRGKRWKETNFLDSPLSC